MTKGEMIEMVETALGKALEDIVDFSTWNFKCKLCKDKKVFVSEKAIIELAKEKKNILKEID